MKSWRILLGESPHSETRFASPGRAWDVWNHQVTQSMVDPVVYIYIQCVCIYIVFIYIIIYIEYNNNTLYSLIYIVYMVHMYIYIHYSIYIYICIALSKIANPQLRWCPECLSRQAPSFGGTQDNVRQQFSWAIQNQLTSTKPIYDSFPTNHY